MKKKGMGWRGRIFLVLGLALSALFMHTTLLLAIGLLPTVGAAAIDRSRQKSKLISVAAMNLAGCTPFLMQLWMGGNNMETTKDILFEPRTIIVIYLIAACGYLIEIAVSGIVSQVMLQRAQMRLKSIEKQQKELVDRWGQPVDGTYSLDDFGFPYGSDK